jgi:hypothetical protein
MGECDKKSSEKRELQQDSSKKATFFSCADCRNEFAQPSRLYLSICTSSATKALASNGPLYLGHIAHVCQQAASKPDFDMLAAAAPASADRRTFVLSLIGKPDLQLVEQRKPFHLRADDFAAHRRGFPPRWCSRH